MALSFFLLWDAVLWRRILLAHSGIVVYNKFIRRTNGGCGYAEEKDKLSVHRLRV